MHSRETHTPAAGGTESAPGRYASVNGLQPYYEVHGAGQPLILLHGGVAASEAFGANLSELATARQVIAVHLQGHGHTRDIDRPLRFELMADDIAALIAQLGLAQVDLLGYSMGAGVALQTAFRHPDLIRKLVVVSEPMQRTGWYPEGLTSLEQMTQQASQLGASLQQSPLAELYPAVHWAGLFAKMGEMARQDYDWSAEVAKLTAPTMLVFADADAIRPEHIVAFYRLLGGGQRDAGLDGAARPVARLAIVPGTTHYDLLATTLIAQLVAPFLDAPDAATT